jgi:VWFA-related protein
MRFAWISVLLLPVLALALQDQTPTLHSETRVVQIDVAVRDSHGLPVNGLTKDDFTITDAGKPRTIAIFSADPNGQPANAISSPPQALPPKLPPGIFSNRVPAPGPPEHVTVILLDGILASFGDLAQARRSVMDLMTKLPGGERIAIYAAHRVSPSPYAPAVLAVIQDFTFDRDLLRKSIAAWTPPATMGPAPGIAETKLRPSPANQPPPDVAAQFVHRVDTITAGIAVDQGVMGSMDFLRLIGEHLALLPGRKSLIWVTPGLPPTVLNGHGDMRDNTVAVLNDANVALSAVDMRGLTMGNPAPKIAGMQQLADATGGQVYHDRNDIDGAIAEAMEASHTNYTLGFYLADNERDETFHKLAVQVNRPGLELHYRLGYIADSPSAKLPTAKEDLDTARLNPVDDDAISVSARVEVIPGQPRASLHLTMSIDSHALSLRQNGDTSAGKVNEKIVELNERGAILGQLVDTKAFEIPDNALEHFRNTGLSWDQEMHLIPGAVTVRVIVRDQATGRIGSLSIPLKKPAITN